MAPRHRSPNQQNQNVSFEYLPRGHCISWRKRTLDKLVSLSIFSKFLLVIVTLVSPLRSSVGILSSISRHDFKAFIREAEDARADTPADRLRTLSSAICDIYISVAGIVDENACTHSWSRGGAILVGTRGWSNSILDSAMRKPPQTGVRGIGRMRRICAT